MLRNIDVDVLRAFVTIYESKSFSRAAERLGRTQSTISQQIKKLESILGNNIFLRTNRSVSLTTAGEVLLPYAHKMIALNDEVFGRISNPDISGTVRLGAPEAFAANHLPEALIQFSKSHPSVALDIHCDSSHNLCERLECGEFDLILIKHSSKKLKIYSNRIWEAPLTWAGQEKQTFDYSGPVPLILSPMYCEYRTVMIDALEKQKIKWNAVFTSASITTRVAAARAGLGVTAVPNEILSHSHGLFALGDQSGLPRLPPLEIDLIQNEQTMSDAARRLAEHIIFTLENTPSIREAL